MLRGDFLKSLPEPRGILRSVQIRGRDYLERFGLPSGKSEPWRITDLERLKTLLSRPFFLSRDENESNLIRSMAVPPSDGVRLVLSPSLQSIDDQKLPKEFRQITGADLERLLSSNIPNSASDKDWAIGLNQATAGTVLALRVKGCNPPPLELVAEAQLDRFSPSRVVLVLDSNTQLDLLEVILGKGCSAQSHFLEIHLAEGASLNHGLIALGGGEAGLLANVIVHQKRDSSYSLSMIQEGWSLGRIEPDICQGDGHAHTTLRGLQVSKGTRQVATHSKISFQGPEGTLDQLHKALVADKSHSIFNGAVEVPQIAQRTNAVQLSRNLLLSNNARVDTKPELEIIADDVRCSHGATVSELQKEELFYMRSRGVDTRQATKLLLQGYFQDILRSLPVEAERWSVLERLLESVGD